MDLESNAMPSIQPPPRLAQAFTDIRAGVKDAMSVYNQFQVKQLTKLIEVTRTEIPRQERQKIMNMITIDAHSRDMVRRCTHSPSALSGP